MKAGPLQKTEPDGRKEFFIKRDKTFWTRVRLTEIGNAIAKCQINKNRPVLVCGFGQVIVAENRIQDQQGKKNQQNKISNDHLQ